MVIFQQIGLSYNYSYERFRAKGELKLKRNINKHRATYEFFLVLSSLQNLHFYLLSTLKNVLLSYLRAGYILASHLVLVHENECVHLLVYLYRETRQASTFIKAESLI